MATRLIETQCPNYVTPQKSDEAILKKYVHTLDV